MAKLTTNTPEYASALFHATIKASVKGNPKPIVKGKKKKRAGEEEEHLKQSIKNSEFKIETEPF